MPIGGAAYIGMASEQGMSEADKIEEINISFKILSENFQKIQNSMHNIYVKYAKEYLKYCQDRMENSSKHTTNETLLRFDTIKELSTVLLDIAKSEFEKTDLESLLTALKKFEKYKKPLAMSTLSFLTTRMLDREVGSEKLFKISISFQNEVERLINNQANNETVSNKLFEL